LVSAVAGWIVQSTNTDLVALTPTRAPSNNQLHLLTGGDPVVMGQPHHSSTLKAYIFTWELKVLLPLLNLGSGISYSIILLQIRETFGFPPLPKCYLIVKTRFT
jgi:hypothetical protein